MKKFIVSYRSYSGLEYTPKLSAKAAWEVYKRLSTMGREPEIILA